MANKKTEVLKITPLRDVPIFDISNDTKTLAPI